MTDAQHIAEALRDICRTCDKINDVTSWEVYEAFPSLDRIEDTFYSLVGARYCDHNHDVFREYVANDNVTYAELLGELLYA